MAKIPGKDLQFFIDGLEIPVSSVDFGSSFDTTDTTDTATPGAGKDFAVGRAERTLTVEANLYEPLGAELGDGTELVVGKRYVITSVGDNLPYDEGEIFEANTALELSGDDKVKELKNPIAGRSMSLTLNSVSVAVTDLEYSQKYDELDVTDTATTGDAKEKSVSRAESELKITIITDDATADILTDTTPAKVAFAAAFASGQSVTGFAIPISKNVKAQVSDFAKTDVTLKVVGAPTETELGLALGTLIPFKFRLKKGITANKEYSGNLIVTSKTIKGNVSGMVPVSYSMSISGAVTETEKA